MLSDTRCRTAKTDKSDLWLSDGNSLYLRVRRGGSKTWYVRRRKGSKIKRVRLGAYPAIPLRQARLRAAELALQEEIGSITVEQLCAEFMCVVVEREYRNPDQVTGYLRRAVLPAVGNRMVRDVSRRELVQIVVDYRERGERAANRLRGILNRLFGLAVELGHLDENPMTGVSRRISGYVPKSRDRVLTDDEIRLIWREQHPYAAILRFQLLCGCRLGEVQRGYREGDRWIIPAEISKSGRPHWVFITSTASAQLSEPFVQSNTAVSNWLRRWCDRQGVNPRFTTHDCRRSYATIANENGVDPFIVERTLNHALRGVMETYNRAEYSEQRIHCAKVVEKHLLSVIRE